MLSTSDAVVAVISCSLVSYLIFKKWEPMNLLVLTSLLVLLPTGASAVFVPQYGYSRGLAISFVTYWSTLVSCVLVYRVSPVHPLSRYPGPSRLKLSKCFSVVIAIRGKQHLYIHSLHKKYGDIVRIGPNEVSVRDTSVTHHILGGQGFFKGPNWQGRTMHPQVLPLIAHRDPVEHARRRRPWNRALNVAALKEYHPHVAKRVNQLVDCLLSHEGDTIDITKWIGYFTYDLMGDIMFGGGTELLRDGDLDGLWEVLEQGLDTAIIFENLPWLARLAKYVPNLGKKLKRMRGKALGRTQTRYKNGSTSKDLFYYLSNEDGAEKTSPPPPVVISDGALALVAGSHTTYSVLSNIIYTLLRHPHVYQRLRFDIDKYYPPGEDATDPKYYSQIPYLDAVINETMRVFPAVASGVQFSPIAGTGDKMIGPYYLPEGNQVRVHIWSLHHDPRNFTLPDVFLPERWLLAEGVQEDACVSPHLSAKHLKHNTHAFIPFSLGAANCVGKNLAMQEMRVFTCAFVQKLDMRFADSWDPLDWERDMQDMQVMKVGRLPIVIRPRPLQKGPD